MTDRVDFYVLKSATPKPRWTVACRLTEKAYLRDLRVVVLSEVEADAVTIDELLWTFNERSFVPHGLLRQDQPVDASVPVHLTANLDAIEKADVLVNLSDRLPAGLERFGRIVEIIDADPERLRLGRERFKAYRDRKLALETHQLDETADV
jgi:DNA polymerase-3 subunit chi